MSEDMITNILLGLILLFVFLSWYERSDLRTAWARWRMRARSGVGLRVGNWKRSRELRRGARE